MGTESHSQTSATAYIQCWCIACPLSLSQACKDRSSPGQRQAQSLAAIYNLMLPEDCISRWIVPNTQEEATLSLLRCWGEIFWNMMSMRILEFLDN